MRPPEQAEELEFEVLPPEENRPRTELESIFRWLALIMDNLLRLPGTRWRFGLDPLIGLIPGLGDTSSAIISALALIAAARRGLPRILLARMSLNILINEGVGMIPVVGDVFSFWFKSNARNYDLLRQHLGSARRSSRSDWFFVSLILGALGVFLLVSLAVSYWLMILLWRHFR